ncbi:MAG: helix-turn-helix transcriptional regulator [Bacteroidetes bacterium]|nr:helix-turn-helix transcriptional regulator [Bacteroidota bacterium]
MAGNFGLTFIPKEVSKISVVTDTTELMFIELLPEWLEDISSANEQVLSLLENKKNDEHTLLKMPETPIDYMVANSMQNMLTCGDSGADLIMELKTIILNFLNFYRKSIKDTQYLSSLPFVPHKEELINIWKKIKSNPNISDHRVSQLSKENYLHEKTLNRNFRKLFDQDVSSFVQEHCMNKGYHLITNTRINIDDIAMELGYKESSSFNRAFKRRFKTAPQSFRNIKSKSSLSENEKKLSANDNNR